MSKKLNKKLHKLRCEEKEFYKKLAKSKATKSKVRNTLDISNGSKYKRVEHVDLWN
jgi:hypothetical protein